MEEFEGKGRDEVVLDEVLLLASGQDHVHKALLLEEDESVEAGEEDDAEEDVGEVAGSGHNHLGQGAEVNSHLASTSRPRPSLNC